MVAGIVRCTEARACAPRTAAPRSCAFSAGSFPRPSNVRHGRRKFARCDAAAEGAGPPAAAAAAAAPPPPPTEWWTRTLELPPFPRGCHVVTRALLARIPELAALEVGLCTLFIQHTSASLTVNENASPDVPLDLADAVDRLAPERGVPYRHTDEGPDDMPAHVKASLLGCALTLPVAHGRLALGTWQGIYLNEHRDAGGPRRVVVTLQGRRRADGKQYAAYG